ncbi:hypothetical protein [Kocuria sp.]|uniref:hypothetical protein n=1 Tax=Kocuria sp. TaxID=1871328 RepID=UPI0026DBB81D|nr:hypothetical protein [Kocuria sp.]MDO4918984.1 hypothetical protein [Kocuria sp.]
MAKRTLTRTWLTAATLLGAVAVTGCSGGTSSEPAPATSASPGMQQGSAADTASEGAPSGGTTSASSGEASQGATAASSAEVYELTKTYTDPDGLFTVKYPKDWKAQENRGYLELSSPDGRVTGTVASTKTHPPKGDWFTRPVHPLIGPETPLGEQLDTSVFTYSTYLPAPPKSDQPDAVLWGLTESDNKGIVRLPGGRGRADMWAEFRYSPVNEGNPPLSQSRGVELVNEINGTDDAGAVDAILQSVRHGG